MIVYNELISLLNYKKKTIVIIISHFNYVYHTVKKKKNYKTRKHIGRQKERWIVISEKRAISQAWFRHSKYSWRLSIGFPYCVMPCRTASCCVA